ncbi:hypothetical protein C8A03DRAFT_41784 [Achaetomium macrosporum]|uniref:Uncharacterized protein n=1 Tax=Achaetomium macrosporum TaxID=79813 RepID=A0AAN7CFI0_9PEZI|nr:hypothetical protein C8A03DRAFT_41784 [Achaetomium macrosporum]
MGRHLLLLDFDGTITQHDTLDSLVSLAITAPRPQANDGNDGDDRSSALTALWQEIVRDYVAAHARHVAGYTPPTEERTTLELELAFLESLKVVEAASAGRVSRAGFFSGLSGEELEELGRRAVALGVATHSCSGGDGGAGENGEGNGEKGAVRVRKGLGEFVERMGGEEGLWDLAVVSVNWSGRFIKGVVAGSCPAGDRVRRIVANGIRWPDGDIEGPQELGGEPLATAGDKLRAMRSLREGLEEKKVAYFGDSTTDLPCLIEADLGVIIAGDGESKLLKTLRRLGFEAPHVREAGAESNLVWAKDFAEVLRSGVMDRIQCEACV